MACIVAQGRIRPLYPLHDSSSGSVAAPLVQGHVGRSRAHGDFLTLFPRHLPKMCFRMENYDLGVFALAWALSRVFTLAPALTCIRAHVRVSQARHPTRPREI